MLFYPQEKLSLFIDGANLYGAAKGLQFDIDYKRLLELFARKGILVRAFYYTAVAEDQEFSPLRPLVDWLDYNGFSVVTKPLKEFTDAQGRRRVKGNMDIELAIDVMEMSEQVDHIVIFSGDGDFRRLVEAAQRKGRRVSVVSTIRTQPPMVADELRRQADNFIELEDLKSQIMREVSARSIAAASPHYAQSAERTVTPAEPPRDCPLCPRLAEFRGKNRETQPAYFNAPVPTFGMTSARLLIVGLAPGLHGANRTGRPFTGDFAGDLLYATLLKHGLARGTYDKRADDGLELVDCAITNAAH